MSQALKGAPWLGSYSVVQCIRRSMGQPLYIVQLPMLVCRGREAIVVASPAMHDSAVLPCFHGFPAFLDSLLPRISSICLSAVIRSSHPGIAPQSLNSNSQLLCLPRGPASLSGVCVAAQGLLILTPFRLPQISGFTVSLKLFLL